MIYGTISPILMIISIPLAFFFRHLAHVSLCRILTTPMLLSPKMSSVEHWAKIMIVCYEDRSWASKSMPRCRCCSFLSNFFSFFFVFWLALARLLPYSLKTLLFAATKTAEQKKKSRNSFTPKIEKKIWQKLNQMSPLRKSRRRDVYEVCETRRLTTSPLIPMMMTLVRRFILFFLSSPTLPYWRGTVHTGVVVSAIHAEFLEHKIVAILSRLTFYSFWFDDLICNARWEGAHTTPSTVVWHGRLPLSTSTQCRLPKKNKPLYFRYKMLSCISQRRRRHFYLPLFNLMLLAGDNKFFSSANWVSSRLTPTLSTQSDRNSNGNNRGIISRHQKCVCQWLALSPAE